MPKLWILSDLHLEVMPRPDLFRPSPPDFDVLVAAGDILEGDCAGAFQILANLAQGKPTVFVMGNHEHWNGVVSENTDLAKAMAPRFGVTLLDDSIAMVVGCRFVGGTLWTDYTLAGELPHNAETGEQIDIEHENGSHLITIGDCVNLHMAARTKLEKHIMQMGHEPVIVVTHHAPHPDCLPPESQNSWRAGNAASDLSHLTDTGRVALWIHGYTHHCIDILRPNGTRIVSNAAGPHFQTDGFRDDLVIEAP